MPIDPKNKGLQYFVANIFPTLCTKFYHNRPSFVEDLTKTFWFTFFLEHGAYAFAIIGRKIIDY